MFINTKNLFKLPEPLILPLLLVLKQASKKDVSKELQQLTYNNDILKKIESLGYIKYIKGNKSDTIFNKMRLDKKGTQFLRELDEPDVLEEDIQIFNWLKSAYINEGKQVGNGKATQRYISAFREHSGVSKNHLAFLCNTFLKDENNMEYNNVLEYAFWKPKNVFSVRFVLEDSRLYKYYLNRKEYFDNHFKNIKNG